MRKYFLTLMMLLAVTITASAQKTYVLLAGVSAYQNSQNNLNYTTVDAKSLNAVFKKQGFKTTLITSKYANAANIKKKLRAVANVAKKNDRIIFFFSGHGGPGVLCAYDDYVPYTDVVSILSTSKAKEIYCMVDACHSGSAQESANANYGWAEGKDMLFFMACRPDEYSWENGWVGHGFFTKALIKGLRGKADANNDRKVTVREMFNYVYKDVLNRSKNGQHPQLIGPKSMYGKVMTKW